MYYRGLGRTTCAFRNPMAAFVPLFGQDCIILLITHLRAVGPKTYGMFIQPMIVTEN
jgi:hypothetical protein